MDVGIYRLVFNGTNKCYIGQTVSLSKRLSSHLAAIKAGKGALKLSNAVKEFGEPVLEILLECKEEELDKYEDEAISIFNSVNNGFNTLSNAGDIPRPDNSGDKNGKSIFTNKEIESIFLNIYSMLDKRPVELSKLLNVSISLINAIITGVNHRWLRDVYPIEYDTLINIKGSRNNGKSAKERGIIYPIIVSPDNKEYIVNNIRQFALLHKLDRGCLNRLLNGKAKSHKGWKLKI